MATLQNDKGRTGKTKEEEVGILKSGEEWTLVAQLAQLKTGQGGKGLLRSHLLCPDCDFARL